MSTADDDNSSHMANPPNSTPDIIDLSRDTPEPETEIVDDDTMSAYGSLPYAPDDEDYIPPPSNNPIPEVPFTIRNLLHWMAALMHDAILRSMFATLLAGTEPDGSYPRTGCYYVQLENGPFALRPHFIRFFTDRLIACAGLIAAALNNYVVTDSGFTPEHLPVSVPVIALLQSHINYPAILIFLSRRWKLPVREFLTEEEVIHHIEDIHGILRFGIATFAKIIWTTMRKGKNALCNPGAGIGMTQDEFIRRAGPATHYTDLIESWFNDLLEDRTHRHKIDDAVSKVFAVQHFIYLFLINDGSSVTLLPHRPVGAGNHDTIRVYTTPARLAQNLAMCGY